MKSPGVWLCGHEDHVKCLTRGPFECGRNDVGLRFTIACAEDLEAALDDLRPHYAGLSDVTLCVWMGVCITPLICAFSVEAWRLYQNMNRERGLPWAGGWYDQSARFIQAVDVFDGETAQIKAEQSKGDDDG